MRRNRTVSVRLSEQEYEAIQNWAEDQALPAGTAVRRVVFMLINGMDYGGATAYQDVLDWVEREEQILARLASSCDDGVGVALGLPLGAKGQAQNPHLFVD